MSEKQTFNQYNEQRANVPEIHTAADTPTVLVRRSNGEITTGNVYGEANEKFAIRVEKDGREGTKWVDKAGLSDEVQAGLAAELARDLPVRVGSVALDSTFETKLQQGTQAERSPAAIKIEQLREGLSSADKEGLDRYARYEWDKLNAQKSGDGEASIRAGQYAGQEYRKLSAGAQGIANQYALLWRQR